MNNILSEILFDSSYLFIIAGSIITLIFGLALLLAPASTLKFNSRINQSIKPRTKIKNKVIKAEPFFYRHAKISGALLMTGSLFILYTLNNFNFYLLIPYLPKQLSPLTWGWLLHAGQLFFLFSASFIFIFGLIVFIRPSLIKNFEAYANRWFSVQPFFSFLKTNIHIADKWLHAYPRIFGFLFTSLALFILVILLSDFNSTIFYGFFM